MHTVNHTSAKVRKPRYTYYDYRPAGGIPLTEWAIERQLSLASDYDEQDLVTVLVAMNPDLDESIAADIDTLHDLGDEVERWRDTYPLRYYGAVDQYLGQLHKLARLVRGTR